MTGRSDPRRVGTTGRCGRTAPATHQEHPINRSAPIPTATDGCPKHMTFGPCGGVAADSSCELGAFPCSFLVGEPVRWNGAAGAARSGTPAGAAMRELLASRPVVVADFPAAAMDLDSLRACADLLAGAVDATLVGDSGTARVQFPPTLRAGLIAERGLPVWAGLNCRDRNRVALEGELAGLAAIGAVGVPGVVGVVGVHCVTGDHPGVGHRPDARPVFDLDSTRLAALAAAAGHLVSVAEAPAAPPVRHRPARLAQKAAAGATVCFVNHCGPAEVVAAFVSEVRQTGVDIDFVACVPVVTDRASAELLASFTSLVLPAGFLDGVLRGPDIRAAGISAALDLAESMLAVPGVRGVNLSGGPGPGGEMDYAKALAEIGHRLAVSPAARS